MVIIVIRHSMGIEPEHTYFGPFEDAFEAELHASAVPIMEAYTIESLVAPGDLSSMP